MKKSIHVNLYHGSLSEVCNPEIIQTEKTMDFGEGFYCTTSQQQAMKRALSKMTTETANVGYVNFYKLDQTKLHQLNVKTFPKADESWVNFVESNRKKKKHDYDLVIGPVADDNVNYQMKKYEKNEIDIKTLIKNLKTYKLVNQYLFHTKEALKALTFISSEKIVAKDNTQKESQKRKNNTGEKL